VAAVLDGDTIGLDNGERVRYLGVDTPELQHERSAEQAFAREAAERNQQLVRGKTVLLEADAEDRDRYGRLLRHVWLGDELVPLALIREGLGFTQVNPPNSKHREALEAAQSEARAAGRGVWSGWPTGPTIFLTPVVPGPAAPALGVPPRCPPDTASPRQGAGLLGRAAAVCLAGVRALRSAHAVFLKPPEPTGADLTLVLLPSIWSDFPDSPERYFDRRTVVARGRVELYDGAPELVVRLPDDIRIVE
jgi:micrococcal nuclease